MDAETSIRKLFIKHFPAESNTLIATDFVKDLAKIVDDLIIKEVKRRTSKGAFLSIRELEELLLLIRELKSKYENLETTTTSDVLKFDELKQTEYKLTEYILSNR